MLAGAFDLLRMTSVATGRIYQHNELLQLGEKTHAANSLLGRLCVVLMAMW